MKQPKLGEVGSIFQVKLTIREKVLFAALCSLRAETSDLVSRNNFRWQNSERHKAEKRTDRLIKGLTTYNFT